MTLTNLRGNDFKMREILDFKICFFLKMLYFSLSKTKADKYIGYVLVNDRSAKNVVRPNRTGSVKSTEGSAEPQSNLVKILSKFCQNLGHNYGLEKVHCAKSFSN